MVYEGTDNINKKNLVLYSISICGGKGRSGEREQKSELPFTFRIYPIVEGYDSSKGKEKWISPCSFPSPMPYRNNEYKSLTFSSVPFPPYTV